MQYPSVPDPNTVCDTGNCPALAQVRVAVPGGGELDFCGHHYDGLKSEVKAQLLARDTRKLVQV